MACALVDVLVDNCTYTTSQTMDLGAVSAVFDCAAPFAAPTCGDDTVSNGITLAVSVVTPACTPTGSSPYWADPSLTSVEFTFTYSLSVTATDANGHTCTPAVIPGTPFITYQNLTTSSGLQPLNYDCFLDSITPSITLVNQPAGTPVGCHVLVTTNWTVELYSSQLQKQDLEMTACTPIPCPA